MDEKEKMDIIGQMIGRYITFKTIDNEVNEYIDNENKKLQESLEKTSSAMERLRNTKKYN